MHERWMARIRQQAELWPAQTSASLDQHGAPATSSPTGTWRPAGAASISRTTSPCTSAFDRHRSVRPARGIGARQRSRPLAADDRLGPGPDHRPTTIFSSAGPGPRLGHVEARTANPSIAEDANAGRFSAATTSSAETHPCPR